MDDHGSAMSDKAYHNIAEGVISVAREVADSAFQDRVWIRAAEPGVMSSYEEMLGGLLDDYDVRRVLKNAQLYGFTDNEAAQLRGFVHRILRFVDDHPGATSPEVVAYPDWLEVQDAASALLSYPPSEK
jgi:hypothetical protein